VKHVRVAARTVKDESGKLIEFLGALMDVTDEHRTQQTLEDALREMQALRNHFQLAIDTIPGLVWSALPNGHVDFLNQRWRDYTGLSLDQARGWVGAPPFIPTTFPVSRAIGGRY
jgi:PAS domain-containing protein